MPCKRLSAEYHGPVVILKRPRHDFRGARASFVDQDCQLEFVMFAALRGSKIHTLVFARPSVYTIRGVRVYEQI